MLVAVFRQWTPPEDPRYSICFLRRSLDLPCPGCGMTRALTHLAKGHVAASVSAHPLAPILVVEGILVWTAWGLFLLSPERRALASLSWPWVWFHWLVLGNGALLIAVWLGRVATGTVPW